MEVAASLSAALGWWARRKSVSVSLWCCADEAVRYLCIRVGCDTSFLAAARTIACCAVSRVHVSHL